MVERSDQSHISIPETYADDEANVISDIVSETGLPGDFVNMWAGTIGLLANKRTAGFLGKMEDTKSYLARRIDENPRAAAVLRTMATTKKARTSLKGLDRLSVAYNSLVVGKSDTDRLSNWAELQRIAFDAVAVIKGLLRAENDGIVGSWKRGPSHL